MKSLTGENDTIKVAFGTEGGLFNERAHVPTVVCGPGSMEQGHKADEFVTREQIEKLRRDDEEAPGEIGLEFIPPSSLRCFFTRASRLASLAPQHEGVKKPRRSGMDCPALAPYSSPGTP